MHKPRRHSFAGSLIPAAGFWMAFGFILVSNNAIFAGTDTTSTTALSLRDYLQLVVRNNETLQAKMLDVEIARRRARGAYGIFEPELVASAQADQNRRENTVEQTASLGFFAPTNGLYWDRNNIYRGGIETLVPSGAKIELGYSLREMHNTSQRGAVTNGEYQTFFGVTLTQPLARNFGDAYTMAEIRVQAINSDIAFQEYRRQTMMLVTTAEAAYWNLFLAQEQERAFAESVAVAESVLNDSKARHGAGKGAELDVLEAQSALALRRTRLSDARQKVRETMNQALSLTAASPASANNFRASDHPELLTNAVSYFDTWRNAFELNPDYQSARQRCALEGVRVAYAKNQSLPQVDFKTSWGLNGLGLSPSESWDDIQRGDFSAWSVGVEMRVPLGGGIKARNERAAARLSQQKALLELKSIETQIANAAHTAIYKINGRRESVPEAEAVVNYVQNLLQTEMARLEVGRVESRKVLETEAALLDAKNSLAENLVQYRRAWLEKELVEGAVLRNRGFDLTQEELNSRTGKFLRGGPVVGGDFESNASRVSDVLRDEPGFNPPSAPPRNPDNEALRHKLREHLTEPKP